MYGRISSSERRANMATYDMAKDDMNENEQLMVPVTTSTGLSFLSRMPTCIETRTHGCPLIYFQLTYI